MVITLLNIAMHGSIMMAKATKIVPLIIRKKASQQMEEVQQHKIGISHSSAETKNKFEILKQLSERLKTLQLCKIEYDDLFKLGKEYYFTTNGVTDSSFYNDLQIKRKVLETLSAVVSLRDILKNSFYKTNPNDDILGYLQEWFKEINNKHKKIFKKTLGAKENATLREFTNYFRNELVHNNMHHIDFYLTRIDGKVTAAHLICEFDEFQSNNKNKLTKLLKILYEKYVIDYEIVPLMLGIAKIWQKQEFHEAMHRRIAATPEAYPAYEKYLNRQNQMDKVNLTKDEQDEYSDNNYIQFGFDLIKIPKFLSYYVRQENADIKIEGSSYLTSTSRGDARPDTSSSSMLRFNLGEAFEDIYSLHFDYYTQVHSLICDYLSQDFEAYRLENYNKLSIDFFYSQYRYILAKRPQT